MPCAKQPSKEPIQMDGILFSDGDMFTAYDPGRYNKAQYCEGVSLNQTYTENYYNWEHLVQIIEIVE